MTDKIISETWNSTTQRTLKFAYGMIEDVLDSTEPLEYRVSKIEMALSIINKIGSKELKEKELLGAK